MKQLKLRPIYEVEATHDGSFDCYRFTPAFFERIEAEDAIVLLTYQGRMGLIPAETFANTWRAYKSWLIAMKHGRDRIPASVGRIVWNQTMPLDSRTFRALLESKKESGQDTTSSHTGAKG